jgi:hypothetical protein
MKNRFGDFVIDFFPFQDSESEVTMSLTAAVSNKERSDKGVRRSR